MDENQSETKMNMIALCGNIHNRIEHAENRLEKARDCLGIILADSTFSERTKAIKELTNHLETVKGDMEAAIFNL